MTDIKALLTGLDKNMVIYQITHGLIFDAVQSYRREMHSWRLEVSEYAKSVGARAWKRNAHREIVFDFDKGDKPKRWIKIGDGYAPRHTAKAWPGYERLVVSPPLLPHLEDFGFTGEYTIKQRNKETGTVSAVCYSAIALPSLHWEHIEGEGTYFFLTILDPRKFQQAVEAHLADATADARTELVFGGIGFVGCTDGSMSEVLPEYRDYIIARARWKKAAQNQFGTIGTTGVRRYG